MGTSLTKQDRIPDVDLRGKTVVVTGGNTGIGYETAKGLAQMGAKVIIACRSESRAKEAIDRMNREHEEDKTKKDKAKLTIKVEKPEVEFMPLDLGSLASTVAFAEAYKSRGLPLNVLVCNAGIMSGGAPTNDPTEDGNEIHFQVNYLAHLLLILHLLPVLRASGSEQGLDFSRIVLVSSLAYRSAVWKEADMQGWKQTDMTKRYGNAKLYQIMKMFSLAQRLEGSPVSIFSLHPGLVDTAMLRQDARELSRFEKMVVGLISGMKLSRTPLDGALSSLHAAADPKYAGKTAIYFENAKPSSLTALPRNKEKQEFLWKYSLDCLKDHVTEETLKDLK